MFQISTNNKLLPNFESCKRKVIKVKSRKNKFSKTFDIQSTIAGKISSQTRARCGAKYGDRKQDKLVGGDLLPLTYFLIDVLNSSNRCCTFHPCHPPVAPTLVSDHIENLCTLFSRSARSILSRNHVKIEKPNMKIKKSIFRCP